MKTSSGGQRLTLRTGYAHEFTLFSPARRGGQVHRSRTDAFLCPSTQQRGVIGAKASRWTWWVLDCLGYEPEEDTVVDLFPGSNAVGEAVRTYRRGCQRCGAFVSAARRSDAVYCSAACRQAGYRRRRKG